MGAVANDWILVELGGEWHSLVGNIKVAIFCKNVELNSIYYMFCAKKIWMNSAMNKQIVLKLDIPLAWTTDELGTLYASLLFYNIWDGLAWTWGCKKTFEELARKSNHWYFRAMLNPSLLEHLHKDV